MIQNILNEMIKYDTGDVLRIQHFIKVYSFAHMIGELEGMAGEALQILDIASILHDIGIHQAEKRYGNCMGKYQEELGPDEARKLLAPFNLDDKIIERVCFLISHHHTYDKVDGLDYQILLEADFLVNSFEDSLNNEAVITFRDKVFKTKTGINILNTMFDIAKR
ncbi:MAG: HD domain-containing protein [Lachnospiraceae bacterium]|nr:HD domain-containing protein [Lachnospiraceae bacterium]